MELEIVKAEEGLCSGQVLYHQHISKPAAEVAQKTRDIKDREELRQQRRKQQVCLLLSQTRQPRPYVKILLHVYF